MAHWRPDNPLMSGPWCPAPDVRPPF